MGDLYCYEDSEEDLHPPQSITDPQRPLSSLDKLMELAVSPTLQEEICDEELTRMHEWAMQQHVRPVDPDAWLVETCDQLRKGVMTDDSSVDSHNSNNSNASDNNNNSVEHLYNCHSPTFPTIAVDPSPVPHVPLSLPVFVESFFSRPDERKVGELFTCCNCKAHLSAQSANFQCTAATPLVCEYDFLTPDPHQHQPQPRLSYAGSSSLHSSPHVLCNKCWTDHVSVSHSAYAQSSEGFYYCSVCSEPCPLPLSTDLLQWMLLISIFSLTHKDHPLVYHDISATVLALMREEMKKITAQVARFYGDKWWLWAPREISISVTKRRHAPPLARPITVVAQCKELPVGFESVQKSFEEAVELVEGYLTKKFCSARGPRYLDEPVNVLIQWKVNDLPLDHHKSSKAFHDWLDMIKLWRLPGYSSARYHVLGTKANAKSSVFFQK
jgi:hypothetical protein